MSIETRSGYLSVLNKSKDPQIEEAIIAESQGDCLHALKLLQSSTSLDAAFLRGVTYFRLGEKEKALAEFKYLLTKPEVNFLTPAFHDAIIGKSDAATEMYGGHEFTKFFRTASRSILFRDMHTAVNNTLEAIVPEIDTVTIVDLGIGTGALVESIVQWIPVKKPNIRKIKIFGVEPSSELSEIAREKLFKIQKISTVAVEFSIIPKKAQELDSFFASNFSGFVIVNATASIHHMPKDEKKKLLQVIHSWEPDLFVITDANSDHESDIPDLSFNLIANVTSFYDAVLRYMASADPDTTNHADYKGFCFYDARNIVLETGARRIEFHTTAQKWIGYLLETGFELIPPQKTWLAGVDEHNSSIEDGYLLTAKFRRPISFQIVAKPKDGKS